MRARDQPTACGSWAAEAVNFIWTRDRPGAATFRGRSEAAGGVTPPAKGRIEPPGASLFQLFHFHVKVKHRFILPEF